MPVHLLELSFPTRAKQTTDEISIPGKSCKIIRTYEQYDNIQINATLEINSAADVRALFSWLSGKGILITSDEPDRYYNAISARQITSKRLNGIYRSITVQFTCEPFAYSLTATPAQISTTYTAVENNGTMYSEPIITFKVTADTEPVLKGDVNFDGVVDARDASLVMNEYITVQAGGESTLTDAQKEAADMNNDGLIDARDASLILDAYTNSQSGSTSSSESSSEKQVTIYVNNEALIVGLPSAVVRNGFTVTVDSTNMLIYYTNSDGEKINIMQYSYGDLPLLHTGTNYVKYAGDVDSMSIIVNERWL